MRLSKRAEKPSQWKNTGTFDFLPEQKEPPKGYKTIMDLSLPGVEESHIPLTLDEMEFFNYLTDLNEGVPFHKKLYHKPYLPLIVDAIIPFSKKMRRRYVSMDEYKGVNAVHVLNFFRYLNPTLVDDILDRIKEKIGKKTYKYDVVPQIQTPEEAENSYFKISEISATNLQIPLRNEGVDIIVNQSGQNLLPIRVGNTRISRILLKIKRKFKDNYSIVDSVDRVMQLFSVAPKITDWELVISAEPQDIKHMSTGKGWTSCVDKDRSNFACLDYAVSSRDMVAYAISSKHNNWIARVWLRFDGVSGWWPEAKVYSTGALNEDSFLNKVVSYLKSKGIYGVVGKYSPFASGWSDYAHAISDKNIEELRIQEEVEKFKEIPELESKDKPIFYDIDSTVYLPDILKKLFNKISIYPYSKENSSVYSFRVFLNSSQLEKLLDSPINEFISVKPSFSHNCEFFLSPKIEKMLAEFLSNYLSDYNDILKKALNAFLSKNESLFESIAQTPFNDALQAMKNYKQDFIQDFLNVNKNFFIKSSSQEALFSPDVSTSDLFDDVIILGPLASKADLFSNNNISSFFNIKAICH